MPDRPASTRDLALDAAERLLHEGGYANVSMETVARGAGIRKASLYHHFPGGKDELMTATAERLLDLDQAGFASAIASAGTARARLVAVCAWYFSARRRTERLLRDAVDHLPPPARERLAAHMRRALYDPIHGVLEGGVASGELRPHDTELAAWAFLGLLAEMAEMAGWRGPLLPERLVALFVDGVHA